MKHIGRFLCIFACMIIAASTIIACNSVKTTAYYGDGWYRPDYGAQMEARDDEQGREHIEIPEGVDTIEIDGEEYNVMREWRDFDNDKNNILANDVEMHKFYIEGHKFNGNNYKIYGETGNESVFYRVRNATIENVIFPTNLLFAGNTFSALIESAIDSVIRNCVNYFSTASLEYGGGPIIYEANNCIIENVINYGDMRLGSGICDKALNGTVIKKCVNYGNLSYSHESWYDRNSSDFIIGGIVGIINDDVQIEDCTNYGDIIGKIFCGGIVGCNWDIDNFIYKKISYKDIVNYPEDQLIENCENYGNIYLKLHSELKNTVTNAHNSDLGYYYEEFKKYEYAGVDKASDKHGSNITGIGGIAGFASIIKNCKNHGKFFGFNQLEDDLYVDYCGGIAGIAREITNCETDHTIDDIQEGRALNVGDLVGYILEEM